MQPDLSTRPAADGGGRVELAGKWAFEREWCVGLHRIIGPDGKVVTAIPATVMQGIAAALSPSASAEVAGLNGASADGWRPEGSYPTDGRSFYQLTFRLMKWSAYKPDGQRQMGRKGRWQERGEYGGWENSSAPSGPWHLAGKTVPDALALALDAPSLSAKLAHSNATLTRQADELRDLRAEVERLRGLVEVPAELRAKVRTLVDALDFFDRVKAASEAERIAVGSEHGVWLENAARAVAACALLAPPRSTLDRPEGGVEGGAPC